MADNRKIAEDVLAAVGGKDNVTFVTHCITRLRFNLKDNSIPKDDEIKAINGVIGVNRAGAQYQVIIGPNVDTVYKELCGIGGFAVQDAIDENLDAPKEKRPFSLKNLGTDILDALSGSLTPAIPVMLAASIFKMLCAVLGPSMLNVLPETSDLYTLFTFVGDAGFYFFPVLIGYTAAKKFGLNPAMGIFFGAILIHPTVISLVNEGVSFRVFGIPANLQNYSSTILPILLTVWIASYVEKYCKKVIPDSLRVLGVPTITTLVMLPLMFIVLGPLGGFLGNYICAAIIWFGNVAGPIGAMIIGGLWEFLVMTGMHQVMISQMIMVFTETGYDPVITLGAVSASLAVTGMCLGYWLATKNKEQKSLAMTNTIAAFIGGVTEPGIYGTGVANKKPLIGMIAGGAAGGLYAGLVGVKAFNLVPVANFLALTAYVGGNSANLINGVISGVISIIVAAAVTFVICRNDG
ncbi:MAG: PTS transporter subunit EIIC [Solobacterium sp.]|nr:PTS transporter subunit EIIC [Solobacterium sp.]